MHKLDIINTRVKKTVEEIRKEYTNIIMKKEKKYDK